MFSHVCLGGGGDVSYFRELNLTKIFLTFKKKKKNHPKEKQIRFAMSQFKRFAIFPESFI